MHLSCICKEHQVVVRRCHYQVAYEVVFSRSESCDALAASLLSLVCVSRYPLEVSQVSQSDRNLFLLYKILVVHIAHISDYLSPSLVAVLFLDFEKLFLYNSHQHLFICQEHVVVFDLLAEFFIFIFDLLSFQSLQSGKSHVEYRLCLYF